MLQTPEEIDDIKFNQELERLMFDALDKFQLSDMFFYSRTGTVALISDPGVFIEIDTDGEIYGEPGVFTHVWDELYKSPTLVIALVHLIETLFTDEN